MIIRETSALIKLLKIKLLVAISISFIGCNGAKSIDSVSDESFAAAQGVKSGEGSMDTENSDDAEGVLNGQDLGENGEPLIAQAEGDAVELGAFGAALGDCTSADSEIGVIITCGEEVIVLRHGKDGLNSLVNFERMTSIDPLLCSSESGAIFKTGLDENADGMLSEDEIDSSEFICDGSKGGKGDSCSIIELAELDAVQITCGDESQLVYNGKDGLDGQDGIDGKDGKDGENGKDYSDYDYKSLAKSQKYRVPQSLCRQQRGVLMSHGSDTNENTVLDQEEVRMFTFLCQGSGDVNSCEVDKSEDQNTLLVTCENSSIGINL